MTELPAHLGPAGATDDPVPLVILLAARGPALGLLAPWLDTLACPVSRVSLGPLSPAESPAPRLAHSLAPLPVY